jgi:hypothetical protein
MRRKPLFPPPQETRTDLVTGQPVTKRLRNKGRQSSSVLTINGRIRLLRRWWHSPINGSLAPADQVIDGEQRTVSPGVREMACRLNNDSASFDATADNLQRTAQIAMSGEQLRLLVLAEGQAVLAAQDAAAIPTAFQAEKCVVDPTKPDGPTRMYLGTDGVMVPLVTEAEKVKRREKAVQKRRESGRRLRPLPARREGADCAFKEFKTIVFYDEQGTYWHQRLWRGSRRKVGPVLRREAQRLGFARADERVANVDGASWIRQRLEERPDQLPLDGLGLDFYHLSENVHRCRRGVFGEDSEAGTAWAEALLHSFKHEGYDVAWESLVTWRANMEGTKPREAGDRLMNYVSERRDMIQYPEFQQKGWQIGSGPTESRCKTSTSRLKGRGRRWDAPNAERVAALTSLKDSDQWNLYWTDASPDAKRT